MSLFNRIKQSTWPFWANVSFTALNLFFFLQSGSTLSFVVACGCACFAVFAWQQDTKRLR